MSSSCPIALIIRRQTASRVVPVRSEFLGPSLAFRFGGVAIPPQHQARRQMSISDTTGHGYYARHVDNRLTSTTCSSTKAALVLPWGKRAMRHFRRLTLLADKESRPPRTDVWSR